MQIPSVNTFSLNTFPPEIWQGKIIPPLREKEQRALACTSHDFNKTMNKIWFTAAYGNEILTRMQQIADGWAACWESMRSESPEAWRWSKPESKCFQDLKIEYIRKVSEKDLIVKVKDFIYFISHETMSLKKLK